MNLIEKYGFSTILKPEDDPGLVEMVLEATHHKFCNGNSSMYSAGIWTTGSVILRLC